MANNSDTYDFIVAGAGSAGCAIAARLSEDADVRVLLLEAGRRDTNPWIHVPVGYFKTMHNPSVDWCYRTDPDPGLNGRRLNWPRGKVLGGSSSLNGLLYIRGQPEDYNEWSAMGNPGWSWQEVLPYFLKSENQERGANAHHGSGGPLTVSDIRFRRKITDAFIDAALEAGIPPNDDFNGESQEGVGYFQLTAHGGRRCSTAQAFLKPAKSRPNLDVVTSAHVTRLTREGRRITGVEYRRGSQLFHGTSRRETVLSAGAIGSPQLLQLSGIGPGALSREMGIEPVLDLPGVGANLQDHLQIRAVYKCSQPTLNDEIRNPLRRLLIGLQYLLFRTGPMTMAASQVAIFTRTSERAERPDIQFHFQPLSSDSPGEGTHDFSAFTSSVCQLRPTSTGQVKITSPDPDEHPSIQPNYLSTEHDCEVAIGGMRVSRRIASMPALQPFITDEYDPGSHVQTDDQLLEHARDTANTIYHPTGTCRMGPADDARSVVDHRLRVHGLDDLRVADASIMPAIVSGNTNAPSIMIGEKCADMIREDWV
ncbi:MAG: choline dehydrogenase [Gammaproteobacteria bacterium]|nr:choline dehydrogenase [Gammaproteobacteria bacterium]